QVPLLCVRVPVVGIHYSPDVTRCKLSLRGRNGRERVNSKAPVRKFDTGAGHDVGTRDSKDSGEDRGIDLLNHEERNVQERLTIIKAIAAAQHMFSSSADIPSETHARAKVATIVMRQRPRGGMINCLECQVSPVFLLCLGAD